MLELPSILDSLGRPLRDLRLSVTDRCNFRCTYCMPKEVFGRDHAFLPKADILSLEELARVARLFVALGVEKIRVTGGEPLLRRNLPHLIEQLAGIDGLRDLTLTTNGSALPALAKPLRDAGLQRITVSLDALNDEVFRSMNDVDFPVARVLEGIDAALTAGLSPVKVNMVVKRGVNEDQIVPMLRHFAGTGVIVRFIEFMDVGMTNGWRMDDVFAAGEIIQLIRRHFTVQPLERQTSGDVAERWRHDTGEFGIIASVTRPFCRACTRVRVSAEGRLHTCLFGHESHDVRALLRGGLSDEAVLQALRGIWQVRSDRYSETRASQTDDLGLKPEMSAIGG